jgi:hypothetical protein
MSSFYEMSVEVSGYDPAKVAEIQAAAEQEWPFDDWWRAGDENDSAATMHASGQNSLCGGESEEEFTERLSLAIWRANGGYCHVSVDATYLENLPFETHELDEADYARLIQDDHNSSTGDAQT